MITYSSISLSFILLKWPEDGKIKILGNTNAYIPLHRCSWRFQKRLFFKNTAVKTLNNVRNSKTLPTGVDEFLANYSLLRRHDIGKDKLSLSISVLLPCRYYAASQSNQKVTASYFPFRVYVSLILK